MLYNKSVVILANQVGPPVRGLQCFGRDQFIDLVWEKLSLGHVLLTAPRRFGKTSIMYKLVDAPRWEYQVLIADLEYLREPADLITLFTELLMRNPVTSRSLKGLSFLSGRLWSWFRESVEEVELYKLKLKLRDELRPHWRESGDELLHRLAGCGHTIVFLLDEFPMMIDGMMRRDQGTEDARAILRWLRAVRQRPECQNIRFLVGGSVGIGAILRNLGEVSSINDFEALKLEPFTRPTALRFLAGLADGQQTALSPGCQRKMLELVGLPIPYFLQVLFSEVRKDHLQTGTAITPRLIERVYHQRLLGVECKTYFDHYYGRIREYYARDLERAVKRMLREVAVTTEVSRDAFYQIYRKEAGPAATAEQFNDVAAELENDFYVRPSTDGKHYTFACKILRDWWLRYYGMEYGD